MKAKLLSSELVSGIGIMPDLFNCEIFLPDVLEEFGTDLRGVVEEYFGDVVIDSSIVAEFLSLLESNQIELVFDEENEKIAIQENSTSDSDQVKGSLTEYDEFGKDNQGNDVNGFNDKGIHYETGKKHDKNGLDKDGNLISKKKFKFSK